MSVREGLEQARYAVGRGISQGRACTLLSVARSCLDYQCKMAVKDRPIVAAMRQYSEQYPRYGARRIRIFLRRDGLVLGHDQKAPSGLELVCRYPLKEPVSAIAVKIDNCI